MTMKRRGFFGAIAAALGLGAAKVDESKPYIFSWCGGRPITDHPIWSKDRGWASKKHRAFCNGQELHRVRRMVTGPGGWADILVTNSAGGVMWNEDRTGPKELRVYGNIQYVCEERT